MPTNHNIQIPFINGSACTVFPYQDCNALFPPSTASHLLLRRLLSFCAGTTEEASQVKKGFKLPRPIMTNGDLARLINSDEVQSVVKPQKANSKHAALKKNPLRNLGALLKLNPYAKAARRAELLCAAQKAKARKLEQARAAKKESKKVGSGDWWFKQGPAGAD